MLFDIWCLLVREYQLSFDFFSVSHIKIPRWGIFIYFDDFPCYFILFSFLDIVDFFLAAVFLTITPFEQAMSTCFVASLYSF